MHGDLLTCYKPISLEVLFRPLRKENVGLIEEKDAVPPIGQREVHL